MSKLLPRTHWLSENCTSRAETSLRDRVAEDVLERVALGHAPHARCRRSTASSTSQSTRVVSASSSSIGSVGADHARRELREHQRPLRALEVRLADVVEVVEPDRDDLSRPERRGELTGDGLAEGQLARVDAGAQQRGEVTLTAEPAIAVGAGSREVLGAVDAYRREPHPTNVQSRRGTGTGGAPPSRAGRARGRSRAGAGTGALPRHGNRSGAPRRPDHRRRLDVDGDDAVQPRPARARRPRRRGRDRGRRGRARLQHDRRLGQPVAGDARDARVADLARGDRRLDRADGARARLRRPRLPGRLRQDGAGRADGARARRQAGRRRSTAGRCAPAAGAAARSRSRTSGRPSARRSAG